MTSSKTARMWIVYAFLPALTAALVAIFAKLGLREVDPTLATTLRSVIMAMFLVVVAWALGRFEGFSAANYSGRDWLLLVLAGVAGALPWLFYFFAVRDGVASAVVAIDRLSIVIVVGMAAVFLTETVTWRTAGGACLMMLGAVMIAARDGNMTRWWADFVRLAKSVARRSRRCVPGPGTNGFLSGPRRVLGGGTMTMPGTPVRRGTILCCALFLVAAAAGTAGQLAAEGDLALSSELQQLLQAEMREVSAGMQTLVPAIATGDWRRVAQTSARIQASYILSQTLTEAQRRALDDALPGSFKLMDHGFHVRAGKLSEAAVAHDAELVVYYYARLLESCTACHAAFATSRFPGFARSVEGEHHH